MNKIAIFVPIKLISERLPNKMLCLLNEKPLFTYIFETLLELKKDIECDIYCFCSDESIKTCLPFGIIFLKRDPSLDSKDTKGMQIYKSFAEKIDSCYYVLCHATSPFIKKESIIQGIQDVISGKNDSALSVEKLQKHTFYDNQPLNFEKTDWIKTQDLKPIFVTTSAFFVFTKNLLNENRHIGDNPSKIETNFKESIDIDYYSDLELANYYYHI